MNYNVFISAPVKSNGKNPEICRTKCNLFSFAGAVSFIGEVTRALEGDIVLLVSIIATHA